MEKNRQVYNKEELNSPVFALFDEIKRRLPAEIANRLRSNRKVVTHGTRQQSNFNIWDGTQNDVLHRNHFKYCLAYDPLLLNNRKNDGFFHLWLNTVRIYRKREDIKAQLEAQISQVAPKDFKLDFVEGRAISCGKVFDWPTDLRKLPELIANDFARLISAIHPVLIPIIEQFSFSPLKKGERRAVVAERGRIPINQSGVIDIDRVRDYSRSFPGSWVPEILAKTNSLCANCGADLQVTPYHIDHILPFSRGGKSVMENLQALCAPCNLQKGNRV